MNRDVIREIINRYRLKHLVFGAGSAVLILLVVGLVGAYETPESWSFSKKVRSLVSFPVVLVDGRNAVPMSELSENLDSLKRFYETQDFSELGLRVDFSTPEGERRLKVREREIVNKMLEDEAMRIIAERRGIRISDEQATAEVAQRLQELGADGTQDVKNRLSRLYGWNLADFERKVVLPRLYEEALVKSFEENAANFASARERIEKVKKELEDGRDFSDVAKEFSEGSTADQGGELGWFLYNDLVAELREPAKTQKIGVPGDIIESSLGFHVLRVEDRKSGEKGEMVRVRQIFIPKKKFAEWLAEEMRGMDIRVLVREYQWNKETSRVEFRDPELRSFEQKLLQNAQGDAAFLL